MERIAGNLSRLVEGRDLSPVFMEEVHAAAEEGELQRFFDAVAYLLAALGEASPQTHEDRFYMRVLDSSWIHQWLAMMVPGT